MFGYIEDAKTIGTIFINSIAYTLCSASSHVLMKVKMDGKELQPMHKFDSINGYLSLPGLRYGQSCDILFDLNNKLT